MGLAAYLWIAAGGALGSVSRAWLTLAAARWFGATFPWGVLIINVLGSFVIGFFGTLTAQSGRWPASAEMRAFVMVGICGGFTTFSSFSLGTLELARQGKGGAAMANVGASVVLCLVAVAVGHYAAAGLSQGR